MKYAVEHATEVKREVVNARQRKQDYQHAVAGFLPSVTGGVQGQYAWGRNIDPETNTYNNVTTFNNYYQLYAELNVFDGFATINALKQAKLSRDYSATAMQKIQDDRAIDVMQKYVDAAYAEASIRIASEKLNESKRMLAKMKRLYELGEKGRGSVRVRAKYNVVPGENMLEITQIPPTTTVEAIMDKISELVKAGKLKEISDMRDETDLNGLKLTLDLKRGVDADKLMAKLFKATPLEDSFSANFNILVSGQPRVMGVREILQEWTAFRMECVRRRTYYDLHGKEKRLHLLQGLAAILLDIDKAIHIIRTTEEETEVVPNLMIGFGIDEVQADYVAEIKLRHLNREYILKRTSEIEQLEKDIADLNDVLAKPARIRRIIINELNEVAKKYGQPRRSEILYDLPEEENGAEEETVPDYPVTVFFTREGYLKKIPPQSLRTAGAHKLKEGDEIIQQVETRNNMESLFFTDKQQVYKVRLAELEDGKVAQMGIYLPGRLGMDEGENILAMVITGDYAGYMYFFFANGKCAKIPLSSYATKQNRRKLLKAYSDKEELSLMLYLPEETELAIRTSASRMLLVGTAQIPAKTTRDSQGVAVVTLKKNQRIASVVPADTLELANPHRYRVRSLPATGALIRAEDEGEQMSLL